MINLPELFVMICKVKMIFKIDAKGAGPGEYTDVNTFVINEQSRELIIYDNHKQSLLFYNADNGIFFKTQKLVKPDPTAMASLGEFIIMIIGIIVTIRMTLIYIIPY